MAQFKNMYKVELNNGVAPVVSLKQIYYADVEANRIGAIVTMNGQPFPLSGTCTGSAILADGSTVPMAGVIDGNQAYIDLDSSCYSVEGQIKIFVKITTGGVTTTLLAAVGTVQLTETDTVIDPGTIIPSVTALITAIENAVESIPADYTSLLETIAPLYANLTFPVKAGQWCWYSGVLYEANQDISTSENWTAAHWGTTTVGASLSELKSAFNSFNNVQEISYSPGFLRTNANPGQPVNNLTPEHETPDTVEYAIVECSAGETFILNGTGGSVGRAYCFIKSDNTIIINSSAGFVADMFCITAPIGTAKAIFQRIISSSNLPSYQGTPPYVTVSRFEKTVEDTSLMCEVSFTNGTYKVNEVGIPEDVVTQNYYWSSNLIKVYPGQQIFARKGDYTCYAYFTNDISAPIASSYTLPDNYSIIDIPSGMNYVGFTYRNKTWAVVSDASKMEIKANFFISYISELKSKEQIEYQKADVSLLNLDKEPYIEQLVYKNQVSGSPKVLSLLHFSDLHCGQKNLVRILDYYKTNKDLLNDILCTGDIVDKFSDSFDFFSTEDEAENVLITLGNHDLSTVTNTPYDYDVSQADAYSKFFVGISNWGVTNTANTLYWYKDYSACKIRLIGLCDGLTGIDMTNQLDWLANTALAGAKTNGYAVVIALHFPIMTGTTSTEIMECNFSDYYVTMSNNWHGIETGIMDAVAAFMSDGGEFVAYLCGHTHRDLIMSSTSYPGQLSVSVTISNAYYHQEANQSRPDNGRNFDAFNIVGIDQSAKLLKVLRIGANCDNRLRPRNGICINYQTKEIISQF